jgi:hypothetical protein
MNKEENTIFSVSAHIDLLGFSSNLVLSSYDLRTKIGKEAIQRLRIIENAIELIEEEIEENKNFYPESLRFMRFNDSLILGIDINPPIMPQIGKPNEGGKLSLKQIENYFGNDSEENKVSDKMKEHFNIESFNTSQFIGLISRIHNFINHKEFEMHMPGCRSIISSGLRYKFINKKDKTEDFYTANFSLANAYIANELGSKSGFTGNKCYLEDNVAILCGYNVYPKRILGFTKFLRNDIQDDPYEGTEKNILAMNTNYYISKPLSVDLFNKKYIFREINTFPAAYLQLFPWFTSLITKEFAEESNITKKIIDCIINDTPNLEKINSKENRLLSSPNFSYPILFIPFGLQDKISEYVKIFEN